MCKLITYLESHDYDPEIITNFTKGLDADGKTGKSLEQVIEIGIQRRTDEQLQILARQIDNPYNEIFNLAEKQVADVLVHSVQPRILRSAIKRKTAILTTNEFGIGTFSDVLGSDISHAAGKYTPKYPDYSPHMHDHIMLSAPNLNYQMLGQIAAHEFEHQRDLARQKPFATTNRMILPQDQLVSTRNRITEVMDFLSEFDKNASHEDVQRLRELAAMRGLPGKVGKTSAGELLGIKNKLHQDVFMMEHILSSTFLSPEGGQSHEAYNTKWVQRLEVPAVMEQLRKMVGRDFVAALLPELYELYMQDRLQNRNLRNNGAAASR